MRVSVAVTPSATNFADVTVTHGGTSRLMAGRAKLVVKRRN